MFVGKASPPPPLSLPTRQNPDTCHKSTCLTLFTRSCERVGAGHKTRIYTSQDPPFSSQSVSFPSGTTDTPINGTSLLDTALQVRQTFFPGRTICDRGCFGILTTVHRKEMEM